VRVRAGLIVLLLAACGSSAKVTASSPNTGLAPAAAVLAAGAAKGALPLGTVSRFDKATMFGVMSYKVVDTKDGDAPYLAVDVRAEAPGTDGAMPTVAILCANSTRNGSWYASSTVTFGQVVPAKSFLTGTLDLMLPGDSATGKIVPNCVGPAVIQAKQQFAVTVGSQKAPELDYAIDEATLKQLNDGVDKWNAQVATNTTT